MTRQESPVFVVGCHRSGTNLLYDTLLSSGGFVIYHAASVVYETLIPRFGNLSVLKNRHKLVETWLRSKAFRRAGLDSEVVRGRVLSECRSGGDFLRIIMGEMARQQNATRWANYGPDCVLHISRIKQELPEALFIHIIRDGRDIALSLTRMGGLRHPLRDKRRSLLAAAVYWDWIIQRGRRAGRRIARDYIEVHYEDLVTDPRKTLARLGSFIDHDLNYDRIQSVGIGRVRDPNSSFKTELQETPFNPVNRWKERLSPNDVELIESLIGSSLEEVGYCLTGADRPARSPLALRTSQALYTRFLDAKLWLKSRTPLGRFTSIQNMELLEGANRQYVSPRAFNAKP